MVFKGNNSNTIDNLNDYWHGKDFIIQFLGGTPPTAEDARVLNVDYRDSDELGRVSVGFSTGNPTDAKFWTPVESGNITWVKIFATSNVAEITDNIVVTTDSIGLAHSDTHVWVKDMAVTSGVETKFIFTYINFNIAGATGSEGGI